MNLLQERFFVTGGSGFVGSCLTRKLASLGCDVHVLVRDPASLWRLRGLEHRIHMHVGDLNEGGPLRDLIGDIQPTVIYHLAVHGAYPFQTNADQIILTDVFGTWNLLKACSEVDYKVFLNTGSSSEYGSKVYAMRESDLLEPTVIMPWRRQPKRSSSQHMARADRRPINTFRLFSVYGPYEEPSRLIPTLIRRCMDGSALDMVSPDTARDFIYVDDVIEAYLQIGQLSLQCGEVFNIGTGVQSSMRDIVRAVVRCTGANVKVNWGSIPARTWDTETWLADATKVRRVLKWAPRTGLVEGINKTVDWFRAEGQEVYGEWKQAATK